MIIKLLGTIVAIIAGVIGFVLGVLSYRRTKLSAITEFYLRGDSEEIIESKSYVFEKGRKGEPINVYDHIASKLASHYEFWGKMVHQGYLPLKTFDGAAGITMIKAYTILLPMIEERRFLQNSHYAKEFLWMKGRVERKYKFTI